MHPCVPALGGGVDAGREDAEDSCFVVSSGPAAATKPNTQKDHKGEMRREGRTCFNTAHTLPPTGRKPCLA